MPLKEFVRQVLLENGRAPLIYQAVGRAWRTAIEKYPERARWRRKSTFRALVWEEMVRELSEIGVEDADFVILEHRDTVSFIIEDSILVRLKHADVTLSTSNYPTPEASLFDNHEVDLYGYIGLQRVELCYVLNEFETEIIWIGIAARQNGQHLWKIELSHEGFVAETETLPFEPEQETDPASLAKLKQAKPEQKKEEKKK